MASIVYQKQHVTQTYIKPSIMNRISRTCLWICAFSIAMALLESAVVVYLRSLYYPDGFSVAFKIIDKNILQVELLRELATLVMLLAIACLAATSFTERFAYFLMSFAVWDIFYYVWLWILIDWPVSLMEWDILFLIPFTWLGPVAAPLLCSITMILLALVVLKSGRRVSPAVWALLISGSLLILFTFMEDYGRLIISYGFVSEYPHLLENKEFLTKAEAFIPERFNWIVFLAGQTLLLAAVYIQHRAAQNLSWWTSYPFPGTPEAEH